MPSADQNKPHPNPNCTTENRNACKDKEGIWDSAACECEVSKDPINNDAGLPPIEDSGFDFDFPPIEDSELPPVEEPDLDNKNLELLKDWEDINKQFRQFGITIGVNVLLSWILYD